MAKKKLTQRDVSIRENERQVKALNKVLTEQVIVSELEKELEDVKSENFKLKEELRKYKLSVQLNSINNPETIKKILSYFAKGYTYKIIFDKMVYNGFDGSIEEVANICKNVEDLENSYVLYFKQELKAYEESIKTNPEKIKDRLITVLEQLINDASLDLDSLTEIDEKRKVREEINKHAKELNALLKNAIDDKQGDNLHEAIVSTNTLDDLVDAVMSIEIKEERVLS